MSFILGKKLKMTQIWKENTVVPVTVIKAEPNMVTSIRTKEKDGYSAVQLAVGKPSKGGSVSGGKTKREFRIRDPKSDSRNLKSGDTVDVSVFTEGDMVHVSGLSKGRGFQGVVKRYNFGGGPKTHGQKNRHRAPGSIGSTAFQRVVPGRRMAGHMGTTRVTLKNLKVVGVDVEQGTIMVRGAVPGFKGLVLEVRKAVTTKSTKS